MPNITKYPWEEWFKNRVLTLEKGIHFNCSTKVMSQQIRNAASTHRYNVRVTISETIPNSVITVIVSGGERKYWWEEYLDELKHK